MRRLLVGILLVVMSAGTVAQDEEDALTLDGLLDAVRQGRVIEGRENTQRLKRFRNEQSSRQQMLDDIIALEQREDAGQGTEGLGREEGAVPRPQVVDRDGPLPAERLRSSAHRLNRDRLRRPEARTLLRVALVLEALRLAVSGGDRIGGRSRQASNRAPSVAASLQSPICSLGASVRSRRV